MTITIRGRREIDSPILAISWTDDKSPGGELSGDKEAVDLVRAAALENQGNPIGEPPWCKSDDHHLTHWQGIASLAFLVFYKVEEVSGVGLPDVPEGMDI